MELDAGFNEIACISDFKMLTLASETSIYARTAEIHCHYLMTLSMSRDTQLIPAGRVYLDTLPNSNLWTLGAVPTRTVINI